MYPFLPDFWPILSLFQKEQDVVSKAWTSSVKHDRPLSEVLLPITVMDLIGNSEFQFSHASHLYPYI